jgi:hypothetical protein
MISSLSRKVQSELDKVEPQIKTAFLNAIGGIKNAIQLKVVLDHIEAGRLDQAVLAMRLEDAFFDPFGRLLADTYLQGGRDALARLPAINDPFPSGDIPLCSMEDRPEPKSGSQKSLPC